MSTRPVPVLLYHSISDSPGRLIAPFNVRPHTFERHLEIILEEGYETLTFTQLVNAWNAGKSTENKLVITFDDGYADFFDNALPLMEKRSLVSSLYLTTGFLDGDPSTQVEYRPDDKMLHWKQLNEIATTATEIAAHSHAHPHLDTLNTQQLLENTRLPKQLLEDAIQTEVKSFAYPHGYCGPRVRRFTREAGYSNAAGVRHMLSHSNDDQFNVARLLIQSSHSDNEFRNWLRAQNTPIATAGEEVKTKLWRTYRRIKAATSGRPINVYREDNEANPATGEHP